jgi:predicted DNA-binding transcriptional regulator AlpA
MQAFLDEGSLAAKLLIAVSTLRNWRYLGSGPKFLKLGGAVRYRESDVESWIESESNRVRGALRRGITEPSGAN